MPSSVSVLNTTAYFDSNNAKSDIPIATSIRTNLNIELPQAHSYIQNPEYERKPSMFDKIRTLFRRPKIQPREASIFLVSKRVRGGKKNSKSMKRSRQ
jgi:hypothetical protein